MASIVAAFAIGISTPNAQHGEISADLRAAAARRIEGWLRPVDRIAESSGNHIVVAFHGGLAPAILSRVRRIARAIVEMPLYSDDDLRHLDVGVSWVPLSGDPGTDEQRLRAVIAESDQALRNRDLDLRPGERRGRRIAPGRLLTPLLIALSLVLSAAVPFGIMVIAFTAGVDISPWVYWTVVATLVAMAAVQFIEGVAAQRRIEPPRGSRRVTPSRNGHHRRIPSQRGSHDPGHP